MRQQLAAAGLAIAPQSFAFATGKPRRRGKPAAAKVGALVRCLVIDGRLVVAGSVDLSARERPARLQAAELETASARLAERAARALGLGLAAVDVEMTDRGPRVQTLTAMPRLAEFPQSRFRTPAAALMTAIETHARSVVHRAAPEHEDSLAEGMSESARGSES